MRRAKWDKILSLNPHTRSLQENRGQADIYSSQPLTPQGRTENALQRTLRIPQSWTHVNINVRDPAAASSTCKKAPCHVTSSTSAASIHASVALAAPVFPNASPICAYTGWGNTETSRSSGCMWPEPMQRSWSRSRISAWRTNNFLFFTQNKCLLIVFWDVCLSVRRYVLKFLDYLSEISMDPNEFWTGYSFNYKYRTVLHWAESIGK